MMNQYDFLNLSYVEFEELCRDLLEKEFGFALESFSEGVDGGIDLRYLRAKERQIVIQCKRYGVYKDLYAAIKKELPKIASFSNTNYKIASSVAMTPAQKEKLFVLLSPYLQNQADILSKKDLNTLLRRHPDVEKRHFKLWIQSTAVLERIFKSKVINQSDFEMAQIKAVLKIYVVNPSFDQAETILEKKKFVVISGIPGIGKTTLARVLAYMYLSRKKFSEFVYISDSINEGYEHYKEEVKQVFYFDDFLGQSFEDRTLDRNEDKRIMEFIKKIYRSKDKILLFTTREYILRDVQLKNDLLADPDIDFAKCLIDLSSYTNLIKAKILYNHLFFSGLPTAHVRAFVDPKVYKEIIQHPNYSPRIIETLIKQELASLSEPKTFTKTIIDSLENPFKIWETPFTLQINDLSRWLLTILLTMGPPVLIDDLKESCKKFSEIHGNKYFPHFTQALFTKSIKELEDSFIISLKDDENHRVLEFQNPSVRDFLLHYFEGNKDQLLPIITAAIYKEQLFNIFTSVSTDNKPNPFIRVARRILRDDILNDACLKKIINEGENLLSCNVMTYLTTGSPNKFYMRNKSGQYHLLSTLHLHFHKTSISQQVKEYILQRMETMLELPAGPVNSGEVDSYIQLVKAYSMFLPCQPDKIIEAVSRKFSDLFQYEHYFKEFKTVFPDSFENFIGNDDFIQKIYDMAVMDVQQVKPDKMDDLASTLENLQNIYGMDFSDELKELNPTIDDYEPPDDQGDRFEYNEEQRSEKDEIESIFSSLTELD